MASLTVVELKAEAKRRSLSGYSKLRKSELIALLQRKQGTIILYRMPFLRSYTAPADDYLTVFPNHRHGHRTDGLGLPELSPMRLGVVEHGQQGLPVALNLENFWQQSKQYEDESDADFLLAQVTGFNDATPHRHKRRGVKPKGWIWVDKKGQRHCLDWVTARQFYCHFYAKLAIVTDSFKQLQELRQTRKLRIAGYDAYVIDEVNEVDAAYLQDKVPFGHERVLYAMLTLPAEQWPWVKYGELLRDL